MNHWKLLFLIIFFTIFLYFSLFLLQLFVFPNLLLVDPQKIDITVYPFNNTHVSNLKQKPVDDLEKSEKSQISGIFATGMKVKVHGTGEDGLHVRKNPGTNREILFIAEENSSFLIIEGPQLQDNLIWWKILALTGRNEAGWSVQDYLHVLSN